MKCEGMNIISYNYHELDSELTRYISKLSGHVKFRKYEVNPRWEKHMSSYSKKYQKYKGVYEFPAEFKDTLNLFLNCIINHPF